MYSRAETDNWPMDLYYLFCILNDRNSWVLAGHVATQLGIIFSVWLSDKCTLWPYSERLDMRENDLYNFLDNPIKLKAVLWTSFVSLFLTERMVRAVATTLDSAFNILHWGLLRFPASQNPFMISWSVAFLPMLES